MPILSVAEFPVVVEPGLAHFPSDPPPYAVAIGSTSTPGPAFHPGTRCARIACDVACHIRVGRTPTADPNSAYWPAGHVEYIEVNGGDAIAVIGA
jgi:hypothetical protein